MTVRLADLWEVFEGIMPCVVVTVARDGTPNVSYISQIALIDQDHIALSNQFMSKMVRNLNENPRLTATLVHPVDGRQVVLDLLFDRSESVGPLFDQMSLSILAVAAHHGMDKVMRLKSADLCRVLSVEVQPFRPDHPDGPRPHPTRPDHLSAAVALSLSLARLDDLDHAVDFALDGMQERLGMRHCMLFLADPDRQVLTAIASRGYDRQGAGAEVPWGQGVVGMAAEKALSLRLSCIGRSFLYIDNVRRHGAPEADLLRDIPMPGLSSPVSMLAVPMLTGGEVRGLLFAEAEHRLAFSPSDQQGLELIAAQLGSIAAMAETSRELEAALTGAQFSRTAPLVTGSVVKVRYYAFDDSLFFDDEYVIKGVPGRLLWRMLTVFLEERRTEFTNREFRLDPNLRLPDYKDNLEARLLLLGRRLAENNWPIRVDRSVRGRVHLQVAGSLTLQQQ